ncbi:hypothetical protein [Actinopolyspora mortivallis]|uniref:hypothetical protein n=1 Tax=Actinopolyspora mortivallis TaxID=33906 RepID=UPI0012EE7C48|nr:hypothetical protein [Actinopolyspora mortivallis]
MKPRPVLSATMALISLVIGSIVNGVYPLSAMLTGTSTFSSRELTVFTSISVITILTIPFAVVSLVKETRKKKKEFRDPRTQQD